MCGIKTFVLKMTLQSNHVNGEQKDPLHNVNLHTPPTALRTPDVQVSGSFSSFFDRQGLYSPHLPYGVLVQDSSLQTSF